MDKDTATRKAKAALRRAVDDGASAEERATALRQAKALLASAGLDEIGLRATDIGETAARLDVQAKPAAWVRMLVAAVGEAFGCKTYLRHGGWAPAEVRYCGYAPWHELAAHSFEQLHRQGKSARSQYLASLGKRGKKRTRTLKAHAFAEGWVRGVWARILAPLAEGQTRSGEDAAALARYMDELDLATGKGAKAASDSARGAEAAYAGMAAARSAVLRAGVGVGGQPRALEHLE